MQPIAPSALNCVRERVLVHPTANAQGATPARQGPLDAAVDVLVIGWTAAFLALLKRKGFDSHLEFYRYNARVSWPLDKPIPVSRDDQVLLLRSQGVNYRENWKHYFSIL
ncbi:hypothetical protein B0H13DRAFT_1880204 [Mycena leptocephala]|nr:hypothetical protein B0H13DRAFT_1880204 [Mycena leptocephala]